MSTTSDIHTAVSYSVSAHSVLVRLRTRSSMERGADLSYLSAYPGEKEYLYPPLTCPSHRDSDRAPLEALSARLHPA